MLQKIAHWVNVRPAGTKASAEAFLAIVLFMVGAAFENRVQLIWSTDANDKFIGLIWIVALVATAIIYGWVHLVYMKAIEQEMEVRATQQRAIQAARERLVALHLAQLTQCDELIETKAAVCVEKLRSTLVCDRTRLDELVKIIWDIINSHHNVSVVETERINFEVTLITRSRSDDHLTIAAWKNRDMTRPKSLVTREKSDPSIYDRTEAAKLMTMGAVETIVIEDTADPKANYEQLYVDQKRRIRSSVLHPITSPARKQLGVLVLHCERPKFFRATDQRYWRELFSVFAPAVALELERIDAYNCAVNSWPGPVQFVRYEPF